TNDFPVLSAGPTPHTPLDQWSFTITGEGIEPARWSWDEFRALPSESVTVDIHCVTKWSTLDTTCEGVSVDTLLAAVEHDAASDETLTARTLFLQAPDWPGHRAGQHVDVRLTAEDGYQAQRSYSIASPPGEQPTITVQRLEDGEVSPYLVDELRAGDRLELRGPIGGYFVWDYAHGGPLLLVAGGSGI